MTRSNGFKVISMTEPVIGKVVRSVGTGFQIERYFMNEHGVYDHETITTFELPIRKTSKQYWKAFKEELGKHVSSLKNVYIEDEIVEMFESY